MSTERVLDNRGVPPLLVPTRARMDILQPDGLPAGSEEIVVERVAGGWHIACRVSTQRPIEVAVEVDWLLAPDLSTRLLYISSQDGYGDRRELEIAVTGNGALCHRTAPDGPTQLELGWGPLVEVDFISAAFPTVLLARSPKGVERSLRAVLVDVEDLLPHPQEQRYRWVGETAVVLTLPETGKVIPITLDSDGFVNEYGDLLRRSAPG